MGLEVEQICDCACCVGTFGSVSVAELDWGNKTQIEAVGPPFDYIIGTDVVCILDTVCLSIFNRIYFIIVGINSVKLLDHIRFKLLGYLLNSIYC